MVEWRTKVYSDRSPSVSVRFRLPIRYVVIPFTFFFLSVVVYILYVVVVG